MTSRKLAEAASDVTGESREAGPLICCLAKDDLELLILLLSITSLVLRCKCGAAMP